MSLALKCTAENLADDSVGEELAGRTTEGAGTRSEDRILMPSRQKRGGARTPTLGYSLNSAGRWGTSIQVPTRKTVLQTEDVRKCISPRKSIRGHTSKIWDREAREWTRGEETHSSGLGLFIYFLSLQKEDMFSRLKWTSMFIHMTARPMKLHNQVTYLAVKMYFVLF